MATIAYLLLGAVILTKLDKMTIRELTKQLLDFNPDAKVVVRNGNNPSADFILAWGELNENGMDKTKQSVVTIFIEGEDVEPQDEQSL